MPVPCSNADSLSKWDQMFPVNPVLQGSWYIWCISMREYHEEYHLLWRLQDGPLSASPIFAKHCIISKPLNPFWDLQEKAASCLPAVWIQGCLEGWEEQHGNSGHC